jgi:hypothetical protein
MAVGVGTGVLLVLTVRLLARERWSRFVYRSCWFSFWSWGNYCFFVFISGFGLFAGWLDGAACFGEELLVTVQQLVFSLLATTACLLCCFLGHSY